VIIKLIRGGLWKLSACRQFVFAGIPVAQAFRPEGFHNTYLIARASENPHLRRGELPLWQIRAV